MVHRQDQRADRSARDRHGLPDRVAGRGAAVPGRDHSGRGRAAAPMGPSWQEHRDHNRGSRRTNRTFAGAREPTMAHANLNEITPWRRRSLVIPPDSWRAWVHLAVWE